MIKINLDVEIICNDEFDKKVFEANFLFALKEFLNSQQTKYLCIKMKANKSKL